MKGDNTYWQSHIADSFLYWCHTPLLSHINLVHQQKERTPLKYSLRVNPEFSPALEMKLLIPNSRIQLLRMKAPARGCRE